MKKSIPGQAIKALRGKNLLGGKDKVCHSEAAFASRCKGLRKKDSDAVLVFVGRAYRDEVKGNGLENFFFWDAMTRERLTFVSHDHGRLGLIADFLIDSVPEDSHEREC